MIAIIMGIFFICAVFGVVVTVIAFMENCQEAFIVAIYVTAISLTILLFAAIGNNIVSAIESIGG